MKNLLLLWCASTCFSFEAPAIKHTLLAKEMASLARHIEPDQKPKGPCNYLWDEYKKELTKYGFVSASAEKLWQEFMVCIQKSIEESAARFEKTKEQEDATQKIKEKHCKILK